MLKMFGYFSDKMENIMITIPAPWSVWDGESGCCKPNAHGLS
jgi:hypothetical protein